MTKGSDQATLFQRVKKMFFTGILFLVPIGVTYWLLNLLIAKTQSYARPVVEKIYLAFFDTHFVAPNWLLTLISLVLVIVVVILIGGLANIYIGKKVLGLVDTIMLKLPFIRSIYGGTKQILDAFSIQKSSGSFKKVVLIEYPRRGSWVLGFVTNENMGASEVLLGRGMVGVFIPSTPNPTTGFLLYLDPEELHVLDLDVEEAVKLIVSAGLVFPQNDGRRSPVPLSQTLSHRPPAAMAAGAPEPSSKSQ